MKERKQYINKKQGSNLYLECNFENIREDYFEAQRKLYTNQMERLQIIQEIIQDFTGENKERKTFLQVFDDIKFHCGQLERYEELKKDNALRWHALEYFAEQNKSNELIPAGMIFA
jgi:hypothetical protein